jgi:D-alanyl-D-alanine endopeptidase (penicillin-binding protein 7)
MVSILVVEQDLNEMLPIPESRQVQSSIPHTIKELSRRDLLTLSLVRSDNFASQVLCNHIPNCIEQMNSKAASLGLTNTKFVEPTGLSKENVSTANDLLRLVMVAYTYDAIKEISSMPNAEISAAGKFIKVNNTNPLTSKFTILLSKTGYTNPAGGCLVMVMSSQVGQRIFILLGSRNAKTRVPDMEKLIKKL